MLNFPDVPTVNQIFNGPNGSFKWDGGKWLPAGPASAFAGPTASVGLAAVTGSALTAMRSDAAPALSQAITPTWTGQHNFSAAAGALIKGTTTNDNALAGYVGEYVESKFSTPVGLTSTVPTNLASLTLTPGDWEVGGHLAFGGAATTTVNTLVASLSDVSGTIQQDPSSKESAVVYVGGPTVFQVSTVWLPVAPVRWSLSANRTIYLVAMAWFGTSSCSANAGHLWTRRMR